jgi:predicted HNH restriction endonuclease
MINRLQGFDASRDRNDPRKAAHLFNSLWPSRATEIACARRVARSIRVAHEQADASWVISVFDWGIRLNVGQVLVLQFKSKEVFGYARKARGKSEYAAVHVPCRKFQFELVEMAEISDKVWSDHERFIVDAAKAKQNSPFRRAFSEGAMQHLERLLHTRLPRPTYRKGSSGNNHRSAQFDAEQFLDFPSAGEGGRRLIAHHAIERDHDLIERKKRAVQRKTGRLSCEVCNFDFRIYENLGEGFCEVHHLRPLSEATSVAHTRLKDLVVVCANCHRMIHRYGQARPLSSVRASLKS